MNDVKNVTIHPINPDPHPGRALGFTALLAVALGNVFSASVYSLQAPATGLTGRSAWLAFGVAVIIGFITIVPYMFVAGALVFSGGDFSLVQYGLGKTASGIFAWNFILMCIGPAISVAALGGYVLTLWPGAPGKLIAIIIVTLIFVLNITPIKTVSNAQNIMFAVLCIATAIYVIYGLLHLNPGVFDFSSENYFSGGSSGFIKASTTFTATTSFYVQVYFLGMFAKNPRKHIPKAMFITAIVIFFLYPLMTLVNANTLPWDQTVGQTIVGTARSLMPFGLFVFFVICGPFLATATTLNAGFMGLSKPFTSGAQTGWLPSVFTKKNKAGAPVWAMALLLAVAVIPVLCTDNVMIIANATILVQSLIKLFPLIAAWRIPKLFPEYWKTGLFRKMPLSVFYIIMTICTVVQIALLVSSMTNLAAWQVAVGLGLFCALTVVALVWNKVRGDKVDTSIDYETLS